MKVTYGRFDSTHEEFVITNPATPRAWYNYLWNAQYVALFSQTGQGESLVQDSMGRRKEIVGGRMVFVREAGKFWSINGLPVDENQTGYHCRHGLGYSIIETPEASYRVFVPRSEACELWTVTLRNPTRRRRKLTVFLFVNTIFDGPPKPQAYFPGSCRFEGNALVRRKPIDQSIFMTADCKVAGFDGSYNGFIGHGTEQRPGAVVHGHCGNTDTEMLKSCFALEFAVTISPGKQVTLNAIVGTGDVGKLRKKFFRPGAVEVEFQKVTGAVKTLLGANRITTPEPMLNHFFHPWVKRQLALGTQWARVRHNGFRDQVQDIWALALVNPDEAGKQLRRVLSYQYSTGYAPRTWLDGKILDKDFSDNHVWITYAVHQLVMETGDLSALDWVIPFNDGSKATLYEHMKRAIDFYWQDRARFGLIKIRSGDWNDCLQRVGPKGRGVSIWLSMAWYHANRQFIELARLIGRDTREAERRGTLMKRFVNRHGWDGAWYLRAYNDRGEKLGSRKNKEGTLFMLPQVWSVIADIADGDRGLRAMKAVDRYLETDLGTIKVLNGYSRWNPDIGDASLKVPGTQENGGVYLHACTFKLMADCILKRHDRVALGLQKMLPFYRSNCEPYVFSNSYFAIKNSSLYGLPGQSWGTGTAGWFYVVMLNHIFGVRPGIDGLRLDPCLPPDWKHCSIVRHFRGAEYRLSFDQTLGYHEVKQMIINGQPVDPAQSMPYKRGSTFDVRIVMS